MLHWKDYLIEKAEAEYDRQQEEERIERERAEEEAAIAAADAADQAETAEIRRQVEADYAGQHLTPETIEFLVNQRLEMSGAEHECNDCGILIPVEREICTLCERWYEERGLSLPRIETRPVRLVETAQGRLFGEVA